MNFWLSAPVARIVVYDNLANFAKGEIREFRQLFPTTQPHELHKIAKHSALSMCKLFATKQFADFAKYFANFATPFHTGPPLLLLLLSFSLCSLAPTHSSLPGLILPVIRDIDVQWCELEHSSPGPTLLPELQDFLPETQQDHTGIHIQSSWSHSLSDQVS